MLCSKISNWGPQNEAPEGIGEQLGSPVNELRVREVSGPLVQVEQGNIGLAQKSGAWKKLTLNAKNGRIIKYSIINR
jgi:hypothetical protein